MNQSTILAPKTAPIMPVRQTFSDEERRLLLRAPGIGPGVVSRLESMGYTSLSAIRLVGVDAVVAAVCRGLNNPAWVNRKSALRRALLLD